VVLNLSNLKWRCKFSSAFVINASVRTNLLLSSRFGSGAGFSNYFGQPPYQSKAVDAYIKNLNGLYDGLYNKSGRGYPDVAAQR
jgi:hypothetical protein